jgi:hypothetical protein
MLEAPLTARAEADRDWLAKRFGQRLGAPAREQHPWKPDEEVWVIELQRLTGKTKWYFGSTLEEVYRAIREEAEAALAAKRRAA